ncbi:MAG: hypothetical protein JNL41_09975 [Phenylobacterium sp.]|uniref:hypothetical protein n=1 Tax=Phenylobacterium sp. TaxID=1871053 RepID=UPI001A5B8C4A|nr:hypothetical protein [Phenylobacterium sp.]MBL8554593.1 hypothetical protein [Phenylobacterium sp.]
MSIASPSGQDRSITSELMIWEGITIQVCFEADWLGLEASGAGRPWSHLELQVMDPKGAPLPVTDTGYWSQFLAPGEVEEAGGAVALITAQLEEFSHTKTWRVRRARWEQQDLFG